MITVAILLATGAAIAWALETVLSKPALRHMDMFSYGALRPLFALMFVVPYGILTAGFGFPGWRLLAIAFLAAFYHMINHSVYKGLLFLGASMVDMATGTRSMDRLGGLIHCMPWPPGISHRRDVHLRSSTV